MNIIKLTSQFKKDLKLLANGLPVPEENRPHALTGNYRGYMECHVESDTLLIWWDKEEGIIRLIRFGSHSELF